MDVVADVAAVGVSDNHGNNDKEWILLMAVNKEFYHSWKQIGTTFDLTSDAHIAKFLVRHFEATRSSIKLHVPVSCISCHTTIPLYCSDCVWPRQQRATTPNTDSLSPKVDATVLGDAKDSYTCCSLQADRMTVKTEKEMDVQDVVCLTSQLTCLQDIGENSCENSCENIPGKVSEKSCENISGKVSEKSCENISGKVGGKSCENLSENICENLKCEKCGLICKSIFEWREHEHLYTDSGRHDPGVCQISCPSQSVAYCGTRKKAKTVQRPYLCEVCGCAFATASTLTVHKLRHSGVKKFGCPVCGITFLRKPDLQTHARKHTGDKPYLCQQCGRAYSTLSSLARHKKSHTESKIYRCGQCGDTCSGVSQYRLHKRQHKKSSFNCEICQKSFDHHSKFVVHARSHTGDRPFPCRYCSKAFARQSELNVHVRKHTGEKPFSCSECGKCFSVSGNLLRHALIHNGERPYKCQVCDASFADASTCKQHTHKHSGERLYKCHCGAAFTQAGSLATHKRKKHADIK